MALAWCMVRSRRRTGPPDHETTLVTSPQAFLSLLFFSFSFLHDTRKSSIKGKPFHSMPASPAPSPQRFSPSLGLPRARLTSIIPPTVPMASSKFNLFSFPLLFLLCSGPFLAFSSEPLNAEGNCCPQHSLRRRCMLAVGSSCRVSWLISLLNYLRVPPACSGGADRHQAGAGRPARRAEQLGRGLRRPLQLGHDHLLPTQPRHWPVSSLHPRPFYLALQNAIPRGETNNVRPAGQLSCFVSGERRARACRGRCPGISPTSPILSKCKRKRTYIYLLVCLLSVDT